MTTPIGSASITVQAVTDAFQNTLTRDTDRVLDSLERNFDRTWDNLRHTVDNNTDLMVVTFNQAAADIQQTMRNLKIAKIDTERNLIYIRGAIPGPVNGYAQRPILVQ